MWPEGKAGASLGSKEPPDRGSPILQVLASCPAPFKASYWESQGFPRGPQTHREAQTPGSSHETFLPKVARRDFVPISQ